MKCEGMHCQGCGHRGAAAGGSGAVVALVVIVALALRKDWPAIMSAVQIAALTVAAVAGTAIVITGGVLTRRALRRRAAVRYRRPAVIEGTRLYPPLPPAGRAALGPSRGAGWPYQIRPPVGGDGDARRR